jgi:EAL domain-containing protein (putative c-di-GMP-specific phosphodiesterase class I)
MRIVKLGHARRTGEVQALYRRFDADFELHYQPVVNATTGALTAFEALLRASRGAAAGRYPDLTIERYGGENIVQALDRWVVEHGLAGSQELRDAGITVPIHLNVAVAEINDEMPQAFEEWLTSLGDQHGKAVIEILESSHITNTKHAGTLLRVCHQIGLKVAFDDFGVGYATLLSLQALHPDIVKIDRQFIMTLLDDPRTRSIVRHLIRLAHELRMHIIAEGVEEASQWEWLRIAGCDEIQGYVVSPALSSIADIVRWHEGWMALMDDATRHNLSPAHVRGAGHPAAERSQRENKRIWATRR